MPSKAWHRVDSVWGESQRVRLTTGMPALIGDSAYVRSIHVVAFLQNGDVLLVENKDGTFTFPGGRLEERETLAQALKRELWEEARAVLKNPDAQPTPIAATHVEFLNRLPGRTYRMHPTYFLWVVGFVETLADEPCHDPADGVVGRHILTVEEARGKLGALEESVLDAALRYRVQG